MSRQPLIRLVLGVICAGFAGFGATVSADSTPAGVVIVVSPDNPVRSLSRHELEDIFLGRSTQFPGGGRAVPVDQAAGSIVRSAFNEEVLGRSAAQVRAYWAKLIFTGRGRPPADVADDEAVKAAVNGNPHAIGYIRAEAVDARVQVVTLP